MIFIFDHIPFMTLIEENVVLAPFTTLGVGGPARFFARASSFEDVVRIVKFAKEKKLNITPIGGGSNILVSDKGVDGVVVKMEIPGLIWEEIDEDSVLLTASAGEEWDQVVKESVSNRLYGLENLSGIPGFTGAAPVQNIGAYGVELSDVVLRVEAYDTAKEKKIIFIKEECSFGYRESVFKNSPGRFLITAVTMSLSKKADLISHYKDVAEGIKGKTGSLSVADMRELVLDIRSKKFPDADRLGSAGSFFKNPVITISEYERIKTKYPDIPSYPHGSQHVKVPLAWILDNILHLRGVRSGAVGLFDSQPLVLITSDGATQTEVSLFAEEIKRKVKEATGIEIHHEVKFLS